MLNKLINYKFNFIIFNFYVENKKLNKKNDVKKTKFIFYITNVATNKI